MHDPALLVKVLAPLRIHCNGPSAAIIPVEPVGRVAACDDACALVLEERRRVALQYGGGVAELLERYAGEQAAQGAADLGGGSMFV